jgi:hypothetical protein
MSTPAAPTPGINVFWAMLGRVIAKMLGERAHADIIITIKDGSVQMVRVNRSYLPGSLPQL